jgi:hypothetical protein
MPVHSEDLALDLALDLHETNSAMQIHSSIQRESYMNKRLLALRTCRKGISTTLVFISE